MLTLFGKIAQYMFGTKYYLVSLEEFHGANGCGQRMVSSFIFTSKVDATNFFNKTKYDNRRFDPVEIISFRSRLKYNTHIDAWNYALNH